MKCEPESNRNYLMVVYKVYWQSYYLLCETPLLKIIVTVKLKICWIVQTHVAMNIAAKSREVIALANGQFDCHSCRILRHIPHHSLLPDHVLVTSSACSARLYKYLHNWYNEWRTYVNKCKFSLCFSLFSSRVKFIWKNIMIKISLQDKLYILENTIGINWQK